MDQAEPGYLSARLSPSWPLAVPYRCGASDRSDPSSFNWKALGAPRLEAAFEVGRVREAEFVQVAGGKARLIALLANDHEDGIEIRDTCVAGGGG